MGSMTGTTVGNAAGEAAGSPIGSANANEVEARIRSLVVEQLGVPADEVTAGAHILDDLGADSLDVVELMMALEDAFDIEVPDEAAEGLHTIGDIAQYIAQHTA